jgi:hypothetical protein
MGFTRRVAVHGPALCGIGVLVLVVVLLRARAPRATDHTPGEAQDTTGDVARLDEAQARRKRMVHRRPRRVITRKSASEVTVMCQHRPSCPPAHAPDRDAAHVVADHPDQGWSLLCNGVVLFDDLGEILPNGAVTHEQQADQPELHVASPHRAAHRAA